MVSGSSSCPLLPERALLQGSRKWLHSSPVHGPSSFSLPGLGICRRYRPVTCRLNGEELGSVKVGKKSKRKGVDAAERNLHSSEIGLGPSNRGVSTQSVAAPAEDMGTLNEDEMDVSDDDELRAYRGLVLDVTYRPINVVNWKRALCLDILEKADVLEYYDQAVYSPNRVFFIPAVLKVCNFVHSPKQKMVRLTLNRNNIFLRDKFRCQYCGARDNLTIDHVYAASRGGGWTWDNLVSSHFWLTAWMSQSPDYLCFECPLRFKIMLLDSDMELLLCLEHPGGTEYVIHTIFSQELRPLADYIVLVQSFHSYSNHHFAISKVTACSKCNLHKADKTVEEAHMKLTRPPMEPQAMNSVNLPPNYKTYRSLTRNNGTPVQWLDYLPTGHPKFQ